MRSLVLAAPLMLIAFAGCTPDAVFERRITTSAPHIRGEAIDIETANGAVSVFRAPITEVSIVADIKAVTQERADAVTLDISRDPEGTLVLRPVWPEPGRRDNEACSFEIRLPDADGVTIETQNGAILVQGLAGAADLETSNGRVEVENHDGHALIRTSNGAILVTSLRGSCDADTSNGAITLRDVDGPVAAESSNGRIAISLSDTAAGPVVAKTSNGAIQLEVGPAFVGRVGVSTSNGALDIARMHDSSFTRRSRGSGVLTIGAGGEESRLSTSNGSIEVTRR